MASHANCAQIGMNMASSLFVTINKQINRSNWRAKGMRKPLATSWNGSCVLYMNMHERRNAMDGCDRKTRFVLRVLHMHRSPCPCRRMMSSNDVMWLADLLWPNRFFFSFSWSIGRAGNRPQINMAQFSFEKWLLCLSVSFGAEAMQRAVYGT